MLEMLLDKKLLFVLMGMLTGLGVADKCIVSMTMKRMVEAAGSMSKSNHPLMRLVRAKFEHACMISDTVENVGVFVDKYLYEYKVCGLRLHSLRRLEKMCSGLLIVTGLAGAGITCQVYGMGDEALRMALRLRTRNPGVAVPPDNGRELLYGDGEELHGGLSGKCMSPQV